MLRDKAQDEGWSIEEMLKEQLAFETSSGLTHIVHFGTNKPFYAHELIEICLKKDFDKIQAEKLKSLHRKKAFTDASLYNLHVDRLNGMSIRELARKYNKSTRTIQKYLKMQPPKVEVFKP